MNERVTLSVAGVSVGVGSPEAAVLDWVSEYVEPWWDISPPGPGLVPGGERAVVRARLGGYRELVGRVGQGSVTVGYPRAATFCDRGGDGSVVAVTPADEVAFRWWPGERLMEVFGTGVPRVARASARVARELVRAALVAEGWTLLHASAVVLPGGRAVLVLGRSGAGKSAVAFTLAARAGAAVLGNDRVFARAVTGGGVELAPWPSGAAIGLGLLRSLGWAQLAGQRLAAGADVHPSQDARVTAALLTGEAGPLYEQAGGRELKAHVRPQDFAGWFGVKGARTGRVAAAVFPQVSAGTEPGFDAGRTAAVGESDFMAGRQEDSYPDIFGLTGGQGAGTPKARAALADALTLLPGHAVVLGHDPAANAAFLTGLPGLAPGPEAVPSAGNAAAPGVRAVRG